ncbi:MAG: VWA domain-containing protein [Acidobacteriia bacterium]|nr:VWA domain-containing protein [Terriglobia bacterium]
MKPLTTPAAAAMLLACLSAAAQGAPVESGQSPRNSSPPPIQTDAGNYKFTAHSNLVFLPTQVRRKTGETIYGLKPEQFIVEDNGVSQAVQIEEDPESSGLSLVVVVQCSGFAASEFSKLKGLPAMIDEIAGDAPHEVSVVSFGEAPYVLGGFSGDPDATRLALSKLKPCGHSAGAVTIDTVYYAMNMLKRRQNHYRRAILLISETRDHGSRSKLHDVVAELGITDTVVYSVAFSPARDQLLDALQYSHEKRQEPTFTPPPSSARTSDPAASPAESSDKEPIYLIHPPLFSLPPELIMAINALRRNSASELASLSGGEYINFTTQSGFEQSLRRISNQIHNYYLLSFKPPSSPTYSLHTLRVRVPDHPDAVIQTRKNYWSGILDSPSGNVPQGK